MYYQALLPTRRLGDLGDEREQPVLASVQISWLALPGLVYKWQCRRVILGNQCFFQHWCYSWLKWFLTGHSKDTVRILRLAHCVRTEHDTD